MIAAEHALLKAATEHSAAVLRLVDNLKAARAAQWENAPGARTVTPLMVDDPTGETATRDTRLVLRDTRLVLRAAALDALARLTAATTDLDAAATGLDLALERHLEPAPYRTDPAA